MKLSVIDKSGKPIEEITVDKTVFGAERNEILIHQVAVALQNNQRQGSFSNLTMREVRGHHKKPYRQKGTGNARQGTTKGPQFTGGGIVFAKKPRDFSTKINKVKKLAAFVSAISAKIADKELLVIKDLELKEYKTKSVAGLIAGLKLDGKSICFVNGYKPEFVRSVRNLEKVSSTTPEQLSVLDIVTNRILIISADAIKTIEKQVLKTEEPTPVPVAVKTAAAKTAKAAAAVKPTQKKVTEKAVAVKPTAEKAVTKKPTAAKAVTKKPAAAKAVTAAKAVSAKPTAAKKATPTPPVAKTAKKEAAK
jgi:large subunit ribosomal protein L4